MTLLCVCCFVCFQVIVQNYNSVLTLSHLYHSSDALLVHENDVIHKICAQLMNIKQISFRDVNQVIAHQLGSVFQPTHPAGGGSGYSRNPLGTKGSCCTLLAQVFGYIPSFRTGKEVQSQCCSRVKNRSSTSGFILYQKTCFSFFK